MRKLAPTLAAELDVLLGPNWRTPIQQKKDIRSCDALDLAMLKRIEANVRLLVPLDTALKAEGFTSAQIEYLHKFKKKQPFKYAFSIWESALAQGEIEALRIISSPDTTQKAAEQQRWKLERAMGTDYYAPRTKTIKTINENKTVSVKMAIGKDAIKSPQLQLVPEAEVVKSQSELGPIVLTKEN